MSDPETTKLSFTVEPEYIFDIQSALQEQHGKTLGEIAVTDPAFAYWLVKTALLAISENVDLARDQNGSVIATAADDGPDAPKSISKQAIEEEMPDTVVETLEIELLMFDAPDGFGREHRTPDRATQLVVSFTVEPLDLA